MIETAKLLKEQHQNATFILPRAPSVQLEKLQSTIDEHDLQIKIVDGDKYIYDVMNCCDALIVTAGTATLEATLINTPMVIIYKGSPFNFAIFSRLVKIPHFGLCNIVARKKIVPELIQESAKAPYIAEELEKMITDEDYNHMIRGRLAEVREKLKCNDAATHISDLTLEMLG